MGLGDEQREAMHYHVTSMEIAYHKHRARKSEKGKKGGKS